MATTDLFLVTQTLQRLLDLHVRALLLRQGRAPDLDVTAMPPERVEAATDTLNLHLFHMMEDAHYGNTPGPGRGWPPIARQPLSLLLYYILTAHHEVNEVFDAETQQRLLGLAMKTLHDHPVVDDGLEISPDGGPPQPVLPAALRGRGNKLEIALRPLSPEESLAFWSAEQASTARLAAYYEVRTVFLEPEEPTGAHGTVFDLGLFVGAGQAPVVERVSAVMVFDPPPATGLGPQAIDTVPARATLVTGLTPPPNRVQLAGRALAGDARPGSSMVVLRSPMWRELVPPVRSALVDPALNPSWQVELREDHAGFEVQGQLDVDDGAGGTVTLDVVPGIYAVSVRTTRRQETRSGVARLATAESNQVAFSIGARIDSHDPPGAEGRIVVRIVPLFDVTAAQLDVQFSVDGVRYEEVGAFAGVPAEDRGTFRRRPGEIEFHPLFDPAQAGSHAVRLVVNGAESQPFWVLTP